MITKISKFVKNDIIKYLLKTIIIGMIIFLVNNFLFQLCFVNGVSMEPCLRNGQVIIIKKFNLDFKYGDIIVIKKNNNIIIKRLVGLPNDNIKIDEYLYINDIKKEEYYIEKKYDFAEEIYLNDSQYFVIGDNLNNSIDSRSNEIGIIDRNEIIGKMIFNSIKTVKN